MTKLSVVVLGLIICLSVYLLTNSNGKVEDDNYNIALGLVQDKATAIKIAEAIWLPIYGKNIYDEAPFKARLIHDSVWVVEGDISNGFLPVGGGTAYIEILKRDGRILNVTHGK